MPSDPTLDDLVDFHDQFHLSEKPHVPRSVSSLAYENEQLKKEIQHLRAFLGLIGWEI